MISLIKILSIILFLFNAGPKSLSLDKYLKEALSDYNHFEYKIVSPRNVDLSLIDIDKSREIKIDDQYVYVPVILHDFRGEKQGILTLKVKLYTDVLIANRKIRKNEIITEDDFFVEEKIISNFRSNVLKSRSSLVNARAKRNINSNAVLLESMIEKTPDVNIGEYVNAFLQKGSVNIEFKVKARSEGYVGERIRVSGNDNNVYSAVIIDKNSVKIIE